MLNKKILVLPLAVFLLSVSLSGFYIIRKLSTKPPILFISEHGNALVAEEEFVIQVLPRKSFNASVYRLDVTFDSSILTLVDIFPGTFYEKPAVLRKVIDNKQGLVQYSLGITPQEAQNDIQSKSEIMARFLFKVKPGSMQGETRVTFGQKTLILGKNINYENTSNLLKPLTLEII